MKNGDKIQVWNYVKCRKYAPGLWIAEELNWEWQDWGTLLGTLM